MQSIGLKGEIPQEEPSRRTCHTRFMQGMNVSTGKPLDGMEHLRQSVRDILTTPVGSRVMRRDYGSRLFDLIDRPLNPSTITKIYAATVEALGRWEPRLQVTRVQATSGKPGQIILSVDGVYRPDGANVRINGVEVR